MSKKVKKNLPYISYFYAAVELVVMILTLLGINNIRFANLEPVWIFNIASGTVCMLSSFVFLVSLSPRKQNRSIRTFSLLNFIHFLAITIDIWTWLLEGHVELKGWLYMSDLAQQITSVFLANISFHFMKAAVLDDSDDLRLITFLIDLTAIVAIIIRLLNYGNGFYFYIDEYAHYHRGPYFILSVMYSYFAPLLGIIKLIQKPVQFRQKLPFFILILLPLILTAVFGFFYGVSFLPSGFFLALLPFYSSYFLENDYISHKQQTLFGNFLPASATARLIDQKTGKLLEGKREKVTILVCSIKNFDKVTRLRQPDAYSTMMNHFLDASAKIVEKYKGITIDYLRNGFLCVFGAPTPLNNHADMAVACAIELQSMIRQNNVWNFAHNYPTLDIGIGVHTEQILFASIGTDKHRRYTPLSNEVRRCTSISAFAPNGQVLVSRATIENLTRQAEYTRFAEDLPEEQDAQSLEFQTPVFRVASIKMK